jgi:hypothetical protein
LSCLPIDVIARVSSHPSHRIATTLVAMSRRQLIQSISVRSASVTKLSTSALSSRTDAARPSQSDREGYCTKALYRRSCDSPYVVPIRSGVTKSSVSARPARWGASELITLVPIIYPIASDIEVVRQTELQPVRLYGLCPDRFLLFTVCHFGG